jgi:hypothetical protein
MSDDEISVGAGWVDSAEGQIEGSVRPCLKCGKRGVAFYPGITSRVGAAGPEVSHATCKACGAVHELGAGADPLYRLCAGAEHDEFRPDE